jgi:GntR family transcriptional regulator/MocR family aminotransferase
VQAYEQLLAEGFVTGHAGSGTYVSEQLVERRPSRRTQSADLRLSRFGREASQAVRSVETPPQPRATVRYDFRYGRSDLETFPFELWRRLLLRQARKASVRHFDYASALGNADLRAAICAHLRRSRAVECTPSEIIIVNGSQQALDLVIRVLVERGDPVAIEEPHYNGTREALLVAGARLHPVLVDRNGIKLEKLPKNARLIFVTPSHQFPTGAILPLERRLALLGWASQHNAIIVEDDYDGEFRYDGRPLESLQGLDKEGRTVYIGTFSRTVFPALRIGYIVAPSSSVSAFVAAKWLADLHTATLEQQTLAEFINSGLYERHLRRLRKRHAQRRTVLVQAVRKYLGDRVEIGGGDAGAHVVLWPRQPIEESVAIKQAEKHGVGIYGYTHCFLKTPPRPGFILGFAHLNEIEIREGIQRLRNVF